MRLWPSEHKPNTVLSERSPAITAHGGLGLYKIFNQLINQSIKLLDGECYLSLSLPPLSLSISSSPHSLSSSPHPLSLSPSLFPPHYLSLIYLAVFHLSSPLSLCLSSFLCISPLLFLYTVESLKSFLSYTTYVINHSPDYSEMTRSKLQSLTSDDYIKYHLTLSLIPTWLCVSRGFVGLWPKLFNLQVR